MNFFFFFFLKMDEFQLEFNLVAATLGHTNYCYGWLESALLFVGCLSSIC